jgi:hypothetical protein
VVSFERFRNGMKEDLDHLLGIIKTLGLAKEYTLVVFTHCESYTDEVRQRYYEEFKKYFNFDIEPDNVIYGCFTNMSEINSRYQSLIVEDAKKSIAELREKLRQKSKSVNAAMILSAIERKKPSINSDDE